MASISTRWYAYKIMRENYTKVFRNYDLLTEMLTLRALGSSFMALGEKYGVDHSSIVYQCQKHSVVAMMTQSIMVMKTEPKEKIVYSYKPAPLVDGVWANQEGEKINVGRSYQEYLEIENRRKNSFINRILNSQR